MTLPDRGHDHRNRCSRSTGIGVHHRLERVFTINWNWCSRSAGTRTLSKPCLIWIDESPIDAALVGVSGDGDDDRTLPLDTLRRPDPIAGKPDAAGRLHELRPQARCICRRVISRGCTG
jgi:hypothetical protein